MANKTNVASAGVINLAESILKDAPKLISFADDIDSKLHTIQIPDVNGKVRCDECMDWDHWEYVDHDYADSDSFAKEVKYRCMGKTYLTGYGESGVCENDISIYLDENNEPVFPKVRK